MELNPDSVRSRQEPGLYFLKPTDKVPLEPGF